MRLAWRERPRQWLRWELRCRKQRVQNFSAGFPEKKHLQGLRGALQAAGSGGLSELWTEAWEGRAGLAQPPPLSRWRLFCLVWGESEGFAKRFGSKRLWVRVVMLLPPSTPGFALSRRRRLSEQLAHTPTSFRRDPEDPSAVALKEPWQEKVR